VLYSGYVCEKYSPHTWRHCWRSRALLQPSPTPAQGSRRAWSRRAATPVIWWKLFHRTRSWNNNNNNNNNNGKPYGKKEREIDPLINQHYQYIQWSAFNLALRLEKCTRLVVERGKVKQTDGLQLTIGNIQDVEVSQRYKYLGMLQRQGNLQPLEQFFKIYKLGQPLQKILVLSITCKVLRVG
jgi:CRISPR/Cas system-associated endoribonuclease Cas2